MRVEPPGAGLPSRADLRLPDPALRGALVAAALVGVAVGEGHLAITGALVAAASMSGRAGAAVLLATIATAVRWRTGSIAAVVGAQEVLGPAGSTGSLTAVLSSWLAAGSLVLAARRVRPDAAGWLAVAPMGLLSALIVAGGATDAAVLWRVVASVAASAVAVGVAAFRLRRSDHDAALGGIAVAVGAAAVITAAVSS